MSIIKRIATTLHASVDKTVASIENHDAIIKASVAESRRAVATASVKLQRLKTDGQRQQQHINELKHRIEQWTIRAKSVAETDRDKALACLQQRQADQTQLDHATATLTQHNELIARMQERVTELQNRVSDILRQHTELQTRDTVSRATQQLDNLEHSPRLNIDDTFDRWEVSIQEREMHTQIDNDTRPTPDDLNAEFTVAEQQEALNKELEALIKT